jgi:hypothetical protein
MNTTEEQPRCIVIFGKPGGIRTSRDLLEGLGALMGDVASGRIPNGRANAICNAAGKILTTVKLEQQYGKKGTPTANPTLQLIEDQARAGIDRVADPMLSAQATAKT